MAADQVGGVAAAVPNGDAVSIDTSAANGASRPATVGVPVAPRRPRNTVWMIAGLVLILVSGLAALSIFSSLSSRVDVLVASRPIAKGQVINDQDFQTVSIAAGDGVRAIAPRQVGEYVGLIATGPIGEGSIVHPSQFTSADTEDQEKVVVGAALEAGEYPIAGLRPGDQVLLIEVSGPNSEFNENATGPREIAPGEVVSTAALTQSDVLLISIRVNDSVAVLASERAAQGRLRLVLLDNGLPDDLVEPVDPVEPVEAEEPEAPEE